jgi:hypothetical protein
MIKNEKQENMSWEDLRYRIICDLSGRTLDFWGNPVTTTSFSSANLFTIPPGINYYFSEKEIEAKQLAEEKREAETKRRREAVMRQIKKIVDKEFTALQKFVFKEFLRGKGWTEMAEELSCSESAVRQVFYGNSNTGHGGIIRKLKKVLLGE